MPDLEQVLETIATDLKRLDAEHQAMNTRSGSRFVSPHAAAEYVDHIATGGDSNTWQGSSDATYSVATTSGTGRKGVEFLRDVREARRGSPTANARLKTWLEGTPSAGGYLVPRDVLPGYLEARRATSPLRDRCATYTVSSDEVWVVTEGNTVQVTHTAEAATKLDTTGTVAQKVSTVFKVAGTSHVSDELLDDSNGLAAMIVARQFAAQTGIAIDSAIISGTGTGEPTGIRNAAGVNTQAVDGQTGQLLHNSLVKAQSRIAERFYSVDTIAMHPRDAVKFELAVDTTNRYLFEGGISTRFPRVSIVLDANIPSDLGTGTDETVMIVGDFRAGAAFFSRQALTIDSSSDAAFISDETVYRAVERYGFAVLVPGAFEVLTGVTP